MGLLSRFRLLAPLAALALAGCGLNSVPTAEEQVNAAWGNLQSEYQRRADLIPNLVSTVKGYAAHERETLDAVITARNAGMSAGTPHEQAEAENQITAGLRQLLAVVEHVGGHLEV